MDIIIENLNSIIGNDKLEGNCMYKHNSKFKLREGIDCENLRYNLGKLGEISNNILEIGFNGGHSCVLMLNKNENAKYVAMDIGKHNYTRKCVEYLQKKYNIEYIEGDSKKTLLDYNPSEKFNLIHVDGGHGIRTCKSDIVNSKKFSDDNTILLVDDTDNEKIGNLLNNMIDTNFLIEIDFNKLDLKDTKYQRVFNYIF